MVSTIGLPQPEDENGRAYYVYVYRDPRPGKALCPFYVGKGKAANRRAYDHLRSSKNPFMRSILGKIEDCNLIPQIDIVAWYANESDAHRHEVDLIAQLGRRDLGTGTLCNLTDGGEGTSGARLPKSPEARAKMRAAKIGKRLSAEHRAKLAQAHLGIRPTDETRAKMGAWQQGQTRSQETCDRIGAGHRGKTVSAETRAKMSSVRKGRVLSAEHKQKISIAQIERFKLKRAAGNE